MSKMKVSVNGTAYDVEIENAAISPLSVIVNGKSYQVEVETETMVVAPAASAKVEKVNVVKPAASKPAPVRKAPVESTGNDVRAPMPGVIVEVNVKDGQKVSAGDQVVSLEAMKMKNIIRASQDGVIGSVEVREGQKVAYNDVLVTFQ